MKTYKLSPLEQLKLEQKKLREERTIAEQRMLFQLQYFADNWGSMLTKGVATSIKSKISDTVEGISYSGSASVAPFVTRPSGFNWMGLITSNLPLISTSLWRFSKPALIAFATKKVSSLIFSKIVRRKRKK